MYFYVYDKNLMKDALIGEGSLSLRAAFEDQTLDTRVPLTNRAGTKDAGEIWVTLRMEGGAGGRTGRREETMGMGTTTRTSEMETERMAAMPATHTTRRATEGVVEGERGAVCGQEYFTKTEDRPVVIERVERILEHRPVEKEFVVETRATGVEKMHAGAVESQGVTEKIVHETRPGAPCAGEP